MIFENRTWFIPAVTAIDIPIGLNHVDSDLCWCDPIIEVDGTTGEERVASNPALGRRSSCGNLIQTRNAIEVVDWMEKNRHLQQRSWRGVPIAVGMSSLALPPVLFCSRLR
jgi:hypothetical protein